MVAERAGRAAASDLPFTAEYLRGAVFALVRAAARTGEADYRTLCTWSEELIRAAMAEVPPPRAG